jgi:hypothetical protein
VTRVSCAPCIAMAAEDIRELELGPRHHLASIRSEPDNHKWEETMWRAGLGHCQPVLAFVGRDACQLD